MDEAEFEQLKGEPVRTVAETLEYLDWLRDQMERDAAAVIVLWEAVRKIHERERRLIGEP
jgi:hypothetical protein